MKKRGVLNARLSEIIAGMGHSDRLVICDSGLPVPRSSALVDLALTREIPRFLDAVRVILEEAQVEVAVVATEMESVNKATYQELIKMLPGVKIIKVSHEEFKKMTQDGNNISFVRTGEVTPYANVILVAGVTFD